MSWLVVLEGIDGSGKGTQSRLLQQALIAAGFRAALLSFPRYEQTFFGQRIGDFLNGRFGSLDEVHPFLASLLYAGDRQESRAEILAALSSHEVLICDRYVPSNLAHQGVKVSAADRPQLWDWISRVEYELHQMPRPNQVIFLDVPVETSAELIARKSARSYTDRTADLQEADQGYLRKVHECYTQLASTSRDWKIVPCVVDGQLRSVDDVALELERLVVDRLSHRRLKAVVDSAIAPTVVREPGNPMEFGAGATFDELVSSRKEWLNRSLQAWCGRASRKDLLQAEREWLDLAGRVAPEKTLWVWAWARFPQITHPTLGIEETHRVRVTLKSGNVLSGYPDARRSLKGQLWLVNSSIEEQATISIDEIQSVERVDE